jgi:pyridoxamine 5'-phosphate oxidase
MTQPIFLSTIHEWLSKEQELSSVNNYNAVLATASRDAEPHSRIVAIREITDEGFLFFTQSGTRKVLELRDNPRASMTIWLPQQQREIVSDGVVVALSHEENQHYWETMPRVRQLRFTVYAPISTHVIDSLDELEQQYALLEEKYAQSDIPMSEYYCGFRFVPHSIYFYTPGTTTFSEVIKYNLINGEGSLELVAP